MKRINRIYNQHSIHFIKMMMLLLVFMKIKQSINNNNDHICEQITYGLDCLRAYIQYTYILFSLLSIVNDI